MAEVVLENVAKVFPGGFRAVDGVSLRVRDAEFVVLVGPSGCGKSTTLRMIAGLEEITAGTIRIGPRVVNDIPPRERDVAMVFQNYALYPHMTVYKNLAFGLKLRGVPKAEIERKVHETAELLGIEDLLERNPRALSGGQRQRVAVGRAIVRTPQAFLFDEPLSNLDAKLRLEMRAELKRLHRRLKTTILYVTHDQEEAMTLGDRIVVMKDGAIHQVGSPMEVYACPVNRFVAGFVGMPPMNFLRGRMASVNGSLYFEEGARRLRLPGRLAAGLRTREGREMVLGVRPESMAPTHTGRFREAENGLDVTVSVIEPLGDRMDLHVQTANGQTMICRMDSDRSISDGMTLALGVDMEQVHVFEPGDEGVNVTLTGSGEHARAC